MTNEQKIMKIAQQNNGTVTSKHVDKHGIKRQFLSELIKRGLLEKVGRGIYITPTTINDSLFNLQSTFNRGIFSHQSALFLHGLTDRVPLKHVLTFPTSYNTNKLQNYNIVTYRTKEEFYNLGVVSVLSNNGNELSAYSIEKTLCDICRGNSGVTKEEIVTAFKTYAKTKEKHLNTLYYYAKLLRVEKLVRSYMEVLI